LLIVDFRLQIESKESKKYWSNEIFSQQSTINNFFKE